MTLFLAYFAVYAIVFLFGSAIGSFLNVVIYRLPQGRSPAAGRSACMSCGHVLSPLDMVPVLGWLLLRGKCRYCGQPIAVRYPLVETLTGLLFAALVMRYWFTPALLTAFCAAAVLVAVAFIDLDTLTIPDSLVIALGGCGLLSLVTEPGIPLWSRAAGLLAVSVPLWLITIAIPEAFGGGDIKLMAAAGFFLGLPRLAVAFFLALLAGGLYGGWLLLFRKGRGKHFAFGPFLAAGILLSLLFGQQLFNWYAAFFA